MKKHNEGYIRKGNHSSLKTIKTSNRMQYFY